MAQPLDVSGKIKHRATAADYERLLAGWDYETKRLDLTTSTRKAYAELVAAQRKVELTKELARLADELANAVGARVQAGKVSPVEATRIEVVKAATRTEAFRAEQELSTARAALAALWGDTSATFGRRRRMVRVWTCPRRAPWNHRSRTPPSRSLVGRNRAAAG